MTKLQARLLRSHAPAAFAHRFLRPTPTLAWPSAVRPRAAAPSSTLRIAPKVWKQFVQKFSKIQ